jgi:hypothetical protein
VDKSTHGHSFDASMMLRLKHIPKPKGLIKLPSKNTKNEFFHSHRVSSCSDTF